MRYFNPYHKYLFRGQKRDTTSTDGLGFETDYIEFRGDYLDRKTQQAQYLLKGFNIATEKDMIITRENTGLVVNDRVIDIDGNVGIIAQLETKRINSVAGDRPSENNKDYIFILEK